MCDESIRIIGLSHNFRYDSTTTNMEVLKNEPKCGKYEND